MTSYKYGAKIKQHNRDHILIDKITWKYRMADFQYKFGQEVYIWEHSRLVGECSIMNLEHYNWLSWTFYILFPIMIRDRPLCQKNDSFPTTELKYNLNKPNLHTFFKQWKERKLLKKLKLRKKNKMTKKETDGRKMCKGMKKTLWRKEHHLALWATPLETQSCLSINDKSQSSPIQNTFVTLIFLSVLPTQHLIFYKSAEWHSDIFLLVRAK